MDLKSIIRLCTVQQNHDAKQLLRSTQTEAGSLHHLNSEPSTFPDTNRARKAEKGNEANTSTARVLKLT